jgi:hypothetical protein
LQIVLSKTGRPNFNKEEVASVEKDKRELATIVADIADHLPKEDPNKGRKWRFRARRERERVQKHRDYYFKRITLTLTELLLRTEPTLQIA